MEINIEELKSNEIKISVVGVGGGGSNAINHLITHGVHRSINLIALNTDVQHLNSVKAHNKIQIGEKTAKGLGAGMIPEVGQKSAEESYETIKEALKDSHIVFVTTGLGGGTGTGAAPVIARAAKEIGALTIAVATKPFKVEGKQRERIAEKGLKELKKEVDTIIVIPNEKLLVTVSKQLGLKDSLKLVDNVLSQAVNGISTFILNNSKEGLNVDYADLTTIMNFKGLGLIGIGEKDGQNAENGENSAIEAVREAMESPLMDDVSIKGAKGAIVFFEINEAYPTIAFTEAMNIVYDQVDEDCVAKFGWSFNKEMSPTQIKVTLVVTGFEKEIIQDNTIENNTKEEFSQNIQISLKKNPIKYNTHQLKRVSGLNDDIYDNQDLDQPTFLRNQRD